MKMSGFARSAREGAARWKPRPHQWLPWNTGPRLLRQGTGFAEGQSHVSLGSKSPRRAVPDDQRDGSKLVQWPCGFANIKGTAR